MEPNCKAQEVTQSVVASQQELNNDPREGVGLMVASHKEVIGSIQEETELVSASLKELNDKSQEGTQLVVAFQQVLGDDAKGGAELVASSQKELKYDCHEGAEVVVASQKELNDDPQEGTQVVGAELVVASQQDHINKTPEETELVAAYRQESNDNPHGKGKLEGASQKELNDKSQEETQLVLASQQELRDDIQGGAELVAASQKEFKNDPHDGAGVVVASNKELIGNTQEETELVAASQKELNDETQERSELLETLQKELKSDAQKGAKIVGACGRDLNLDSQEATEVVVAAQKEGSDYNQEGAELVAVSPSKSIDAIKEGAELLAASHKEFKDDDPQEAMELVVIFRKEANDDNQEGTELMTASQKEVTDEAQGGTESVAVSHEAEELDEPCSTDGLAKAASMTTDVLMSNSLPGNASEVPVGLLVKDGNHTHVPVSGGNKMKWKDMARHKPHSLANPATEDSYAIRSSVARKSEPKRRLPKRAGPQPGSIPTPIAANIPIDAIQQISPNFSPHVHNLQSHFSTSLTHGSSPSISLPAVTAHRQQLPYAHVSSLRFDELLQATNSVSWAPGTDCDTPLEPREAVHCVGPPSASASAEASPTHTGEEFSIGAATAGLPRGPRSRLGNQLPPFSLGKPPRPPSSTHSRDSTRWHPSDFTSPPTVNETGPQSPGYGARQPSEANQDSTNQVHSHGLNLPHACRQPLPPANQQFSCPSSLAVPELDPLDDTELPSSFSKRKVSKPGESPQQKRRKLQQLRTQVIKKLKLWGRESKLLQEAGGVGKYNSDRKRLIMGEEQRDVFVKNMVESCRKDPQIREAFLAAVKQLANIGVLHSSARLLMDQDPSGRSKDVFKAWEEIHLEFPESSSAPVNLYKAVDELHKKGEIFMRKLPSVDDTTVCSLTKRSEGPWELVFPDLGPRKRISGGNDEILDEPLRPSKSRP